MSITTSYPMLSFYGRGAEKSCRRGSMTVPSVPETCTGVREKSEEKA